MGEHDTEMGFQCHVLNSEASQYLKLTDSNLRVYSVDNFQDQALMGFILSVLLVKLLQNCFELLLGLAVASPIALLERLLASLVGFEGGVDQSG